MPRALLDGVPFVNLHPSALPRWRGAAPIERSLMAGESESAVAAMLLVEALDAGPVAALERFDVGPDEDAGAVYERALELGLPPLARRSPMPAQAGCATVPQVGEATYAEKITAADRVLDPARPARELHDRVRALSPHIGARLALDGAPHTIWRTPSAPPARRRGRWSATAARSCSAAVARRSSCATCSRPAAAACRRPTGCAACAARCPR